MTELIAKQWIPKPLDEVFPFYADARKLAELFGAHPQELTLRERQAIP